MVVGRMCVLLCVLFAVAFGAQRAQAEPKPEAPPHSRSGATAPQPAPTPSASTTSSTGSASAGSTTATQSSTSTGTHVNSSTSTQVNAPVSTGTNVVQRHAARAASDPRLARTQRPTAPRQGARHQPPSLNSGWPLWLREAGLNELRSVGGSDRSSLLFAAGIALMLLVLAEASFLRLAGSRLGRAGTRGAAQRRPPDEPLPIRRVQLRR